MCYGTAFFFVLCRQPGLKTRGETAIGPLVIIGGGEDRQGSMLILRRVVELAGRVPGGIGVVTTASADGEDAFSLYGAAFSRLGAEGVIPLTIDSRREAERAVYSRHLACLGAAFFSGGDQLRITSLLGGTRFHRALLAAHRRGMVVAGTSAGAAMMSDTMIVEGDAEEYPSRNNVKMAAGLGLWRGVVVDQHFTQRGRIGRLLAALAQNPAVLGVGLDENTAIEVDRGAGCLRVIGAQTVTILDGRAIRQTNAAETGASQPLAVGPVALHVLPAGFGFDLATRRAVGSGDRRD